MMLRRAEHRERARPGPTCRPGTYNGTCATARTGARRLDLPAGQRRRHADRHHPAAADADTRSARRPAPAVLLPWPACASCCRTARRTSPGCQTVTDRRCRQWSLRRLATATPPTRRSAGHGAAVNWVNSAPRHWPAPTAAQRRRATAFRGGTPLLDGFLKIERQGTDGAWSDVTVEILNLGFTGRNIANARHLELPGHDAARPTPPTDPSPNAVIRLQRVRDNPRGGPRQPTTRRAATRRRAYGRPIGKDYLPLALYDPREGARRDDSTATVRQRPLPGGRDALRRTRREQPAALAGRHDRRDRHRTPWTSPATSSTSRTGAATRTSAPTACRRAGADGLPPRRLGDDRRRRVRFRGLHQPDARSSTARLSGNGARRRRRHERQRRRSTPTGGRRGMPLVNGAVVNPTARRRIPAGNATLTTSAPTRCAGEPAVVLPPRAQGRQRRARTAAGQRSCRG